MRTAGDDTGADAAGVRVQVNVQPLLWRAAGGERDGFPADHGGTVAVLVGGVVEPAQGLPRLGAQQLIGGAAQRLTGAGADVGEAPLQVHRAAAAGQPLDEVGQGRLRASGAAAGSDGDRAWLPASGGGAVALGRLFEQPDQSPATGGDVARRCVMYGGRVAGHIRSRDPHRRTPLTGAATSASG